MKKIATWMFSALIVACGDTSPASEDPDADIECVPTAGIDLPDPDFVDSNCDGIDGDIASSLFVASDGDDEEGDGSMASPFRTVQHAISAIAGGQASGKRSILIGKGDYEESIQLVDSIGIYGGYDPASGWTRHTSNRTTIVGGQTTIFAEGVSDIALALLTISSADADDDGGSSIAMKLRGVADMVIRDVFIFAGRGGDGSSGTTPINSPLNGLGGSVGCSVTTCAHDVIGTCYTVEGGSGGNARSPCGAGGRGQGRHPLGQGGLDLGGPRQSHLTSGTCQNQSWTDSVAGDVGTAGAPGASGEPGGSIGEFDEIALSYVPTGGQAGNRGRNGAGGHGGRSNGGLVHCDEHLIAPACGGGGGSGGEGGFGGSGGSGGGASIGILSVDSVSLQLANVEIETSQGGSGGAGGQGSSGGSGGIGAAGGSSAARSCPEGGGLIQLPAGQRGGNGGAGGRGGQGGGGGGGPSIGIVYSGAAPILASEVTFEIGSGGEGGESETSGATGESLDLYEITS